MGWWCGNNNGRTHLRFWFAIKNTFARSYSWSSGDAHSFRVSPSFSIFFQCVVVCLWAFLFLCCTLLLLHRKKRRAKHEERPTWRLFQKEQIRWKSKAFLPCHCNKLHSSRRFTYQSAFPRVPPPCAQLHYVCAIETSLRYRLIRNWLQILQWKNSEERKRHQ